MRARSDSAPACRALRGQLGAARRLLRLGDERALRPRTPPSAVTCSSSARRRRRTGAGRPNDAHVAAGWSGKWFSPCPHRAAALSRAVRARRLYYDCEAHAAASASTTTTSSTARASANERASSCCCPGSRRQPPTRSTRALATDFCSSGDIYYDWCAYVFAPGCSQALGLCDDDDGSGGGGGGAALARQMLTPRNLLARRGSRPTRQR